MRSRGLERVVYVGGTPARPIATAFADAGVELTPALDLAAALDAAERAPVDCLLFADTHSGIARVRRRGYSGPAVAVVDPDGPLPDDAGFAAVVPEDAPDRLVTRTRDVVEEHRLDAERRAGRRRVAALERVREAFVGSKSIETLPSIVADAYQSAWLGRHDPEEDTMEPVAATGVATYHLRTLTAADVNDPVVRALSDGVGGADDGTRAVRVGDSPHVLVCRADAAVTEREYAALEALADTDTTDDATEDLLDDGVRVLGGAFAHELANHLDRAWAALEGSNGPDRTALAAALDRAGTLADDARALAAERLDTEMVCIEEVADEAWERVDAPDATMTLEEDVHLEADPALCRLMLENLFRNAVDHGDPSVTVRLTATDGGFAVVDDGPGIPPDEREQVLEWGYSTDGSGVGLALVDLIAERHGWSVSIEESEEGGARFAFD